MKQFFHPNNFRFTVIAFENRQPQPDLSSPWKMISCTHMYGWSLPFNMLRKSLSSQYLCLYHIRVLHPSLCVPILFFNVFMYVASLILSISYPKPHIPKKKPYKIAVYICLLLIVWYSYRSQWISRNNLYSTLVITSSLGQLRSSILPFPVLGG